MLETQEYLDQNFDGLDLENETLREYKFVNCSFRNINMQEATTQKCQFINCDFSNSHLNASIHESSVFANCRFSGASLFIASLISCKMTGSIFEEANLDGIRIETGVLIHQFEVC